MKVNEPASKQEKYLSVWRSLEAKLMLWAVVLRCESQKRGEEPQVVFPPLHSELGCEKQTKIAVEGLNHPHGAE